MKLSPEVVFQKLQENQVLNVIFRLVVDLSWKDEAEILAREYNTNNGSIFAQYFFQKKKVRLFVPPKSILTHLDYFFDQFSSVGS